MADQEQLEILKQGVDVWNEWRSENQGKLIDLREVHLGLTNFSGANLTEAYFFKTRGSLTSFTSIIVLHKMKQYDDVENNCHSLSYVTV